MAVQAALHTDIALVFDECTPFHVDARVHRPLDRAHAPLAAALPGLARASTAPPASSSTASSRAASTRTCASSPPQAVAASACDGIAIGGSLGGTRSRCTRSWRGRRRPGPRATASPRHLLGIGDVDDLHARRGARRRHLRLRDADAPGAPRHGDRARARRALARRPRQGALAAQPRADPRRLPMPGLRGRLLPRLPALPAQGARADWASGW